MTEIKREAEIKSVHAAGGELSRLEFNWRHASEDINERDYAACICNCIDNRGTNGPSPAVTLVLTRNLRASDRRQIAADRVRLAYRQRHSSFTRHGENFL